MGQATLPEIRPDPSGPLAPDAGPDPGSNGGGPLSALRAPHFLVFWLTITPSLTGVWIRITAQGWLVYDLTGSEFLLGLVGFCQAAPVLIASPIAGALLDVIDRRKVLIAVQLTVASAMAVLGTLAATGLVEVWHVMVIAVINGAASGFDWPARLSLVPSLVPRENLQSAVALNAAAFNGSRVIGPAIGGWLLATVGVAACFYLNALAYLPFALALMLLPIGPTSSAPPETRRTVRSLTANLGEGYRYIWRTPAIRGLLSVDIVPLMFGISYFTLAPAVARDVLGLGEGGLGLLLACNGAGSLAGTISVALLSGIRHRGRLVLIGVALFGLILIAFALSDFLILSLVLILLLGLVNATYGTFNDTLVQTLVDDAFRGRVLSVYSMLWGLTPIGGLLAGFLAQFLGVQTALAINGALILAYVPYLLMRTPLARID
ncbi:MAG: MFS transporter [Chloroflexota bacterium]|nr:MFS transporter [Chloroflexota bacterium]